MDCNFCSIRIPRGTEYIFVTSKGKALYFCSSKCYKNLVKLNRKPRETRWTKTYVEEKQARLKTMEHREAAPKAPAPKTEEAAPEEKEHKVEGKPKPGANKEAGKKSPKPKKPAKKSHTAP